LKGIQAFIKQEGVTVRLEWPSFSADVYICSYCLTYNSLVYLCTQVMQSRDCRDPLGWLDAMLCSMLSLIINWQQQLALCYHSQYARLSYTMPRQNFKAVIIRNINTVLERKIFSY